MARAQKTDSGPDGMSWVALMPFPAFNPLNWWALGTPANAMAASLHATRLALDAWRAGSDGMRAMVRAQQDVMLDMIAKPDGEAPARAESADAESEEAAATSPAAALVQPMLEVTRAYGRMGRAFIVAQRDTMRAFTDAGKPH